MKRVLALLGVSALTAVGFAGVGDAIARDASVGAKGATASVSGGRASASAGGTSVSASRGGASVSSGRSSVSASRGGANVSHGGTRVSASRGGAGIDHGGRGVSAGRDGAGGSMVAGRGDGVHIDAAGNRHYDDLRSWIEDLQSWWSGDDGERDVGERQASTSSQSSTVTQTSKATAKGEGPAVAKNVNVTEQKN